MRARHESKSRRNKNENTGETACPLEGSQAAALSDASWTVYQRLGMTATFERTFRDQLALNGRVITAIILRETKTKFGRYKFGYAWAFVEPIIYVTLFVFVRSFISGVP